MNAHDKTMLDKTSAALTPQPSAVPVKQTKHKIAQGKRIRMMQPRALRQYTHKDGTRHAFNERGEQC
jgi:hypothetical protein